MILAGRFILIKVRILARIRNCPDDVEMKTQSVLLSALLDLLACRYLVRRVGWVQTAAGALYKYLQNEQQGNGVVWGEIERRNGRKRKKFMKGIFYVITRCKNTM